MSSEVNANPVHCGGKVLKLVATYGQYRCNEGVTIVKGGAESQYVLTIMVPPGSGLNGVKLCRSCVGRNCLTHQFL